MISLTITKVRLYIFALSCTGIKRLGGLLVLVARL